MKANKIQCTISINRDMYEHLSKEAINLKISRSQLIEDLLTLAMRCVEVDKYTEVLEAYRRLKNENN